MHEEREYNQEELFLEQVLNIWFRAQLDDIHTILPGQIIEYSGHTRRTAKVQPSIKPRNVNNKILSTAPIENVPVIFPSGGNKKFNMLYPLNAGDGCLLFFCESSLGDWINKNHTANMPDNLIAKSDSLHKFAETDCICIPGLWSIPSVPTTQGNDTDFWLFFQDSSIQIKDSTNDILIKDKNNNTITLDQNGIKQNDVNTNEIKLKSGGIDIIASGDIKLNTGIESFVKGDTLETQLMTIITALQTFSTGLNPTTLTAQAATLATAMGTALGILNLIKSSTIKGE